MKSIYLYFFPKQKKLSTVVDETRTIPTLSVFSSTIPQSYLDKTIKWDDNMYSNKIIFNDVK